jgi:nicotinamidase-related amidase
LIATSVHIDDDARAFPFDPTPADWPSSPLGAALAATGRNQVVVLGVWLEEAVTWLALNCLSVGLDTYVPVDATPAIDAANEPAARARLTQAGAVPTSTAQIIREWAALHVNSRTASAILGTLPSGRSR